MTRKEGRISTMVELLPCKTGPSGSSATARRGVERYRGKGASARTDGLAGMCRPTEEPGST